MYIHTHTHTCFDEVVDLADDDIDIVVLVEGVAQKRQCPGLPFYYKNLWYEGDK